MAARTLIKRGGFIQRFSRGPASRPVEAIFLARLVAGLLASRMIKGGCSSFLTLLALVILPGCSSTLEIGGAYFPAWLLSTLIGFLLTAIVRLGLFRAGIDSWIQPRAIAYPCLALFFILLTYYLFFRS